MKRAKSKRELAVVFDTETTGLVENRTMATKRQAEVVEFYAIVVDLATGETGPELDLLIKPTLKTIAESKKTTAITGITDEMVKFCPTFPNVAHRIVGILESGDLAIAHNVRFDCDVIEIELERIGMRIKWPPVVCTVEQSMHYRGRRLSLSLLHEHLLGTKFDGAHRAKEDVAALVRVAVEMRRRGDL